MWRGQNLCTPLHETKYSLSKNRNAQSWITRKMNSCKQSWIMKIVFSAASNKLGLTWTVKNRQTDQHTHTHRTHTNAHDKNTRYTCSRVIIIA